MNDFQDIFRQFLLGHLLVYKLIYIDFTNLMKTQTPTNELKNQIEVCKNKSN
jgi:hypothetical protein